MSRLLSELNKKNRSPANYDRVLLRPILFVGIGGIAVQALYVLRAFVRQCFGFLPPSARWLAIDFATDPPRPPDQLFSGSLPDEIWEQVRLRQTEQSLLTTDYEYEDLAERMRQGDLDWLSGVVPPEVVAHYSGTEACQIPALSRFFLYLASSAEGSFEEASWVQKLKIHLRTLMPDGDAIHQTMKQGFAGASVLTSPAWIVIVVGTKGGTGTGSLIPFSIAAKWLAAKLGLRVLMNAVLIGGNYRPDDGQELRKDGVSHSLDLDLEAVMRPRSEIMKAPLGPERSADVKGKLFNSIFRQEASGRLEGNERAILAAVARTLKFQYFTKAGFELEKSRNNADEIPRLRSLSLSLGGKAE